MVAGCGPARRCGCGAKAADIDSEQMIIRIVQSKGPQGPARDAAGRRSSSCCGNGGRRARTEAPASRRNNAGCFPVAMSIGL